MTGQQIKYEMILKEEEHKERKPVDRWFLNYCKWYREMCESVGIDFGGKKHGNMAKGN